MFNVREGGPDPRPEEVKKSKKIRHLLLDFDRHHHWAASGSIVYLKR